MYKIIDFFKSFFIKSSIAYAKDSAAILKVFTKAKDDLIKLSEKVDATAIKHDVKIALAQAKIDISNAEKAALADAKLAAQTVAKKIEALLS
jgi:hypothetical protein